MKGCLLTSLGTYIKIKVKDSIVRTFNYTFVSVKYNVLMQCCYRNVTIAKPSALDKNTIND